MTARGAWRLAAAALGVGALFGVGLTAYDVWRAREIAHPRRASLEIAEVEVDFARLTAAVETARGEALITRLPAFRAQLGEILTDATRRDALSPAEIDRLSRLASALDAQFADFSAAAAGDVAALARMSALLRRQSDALSAVSTEARARENATIENHHAALERAAAGALATLGGITALLAVLLGVAAFGGGAQNEADAPADDAEAPRARLADAETEADRGRARFVAMMSHELRTPMNGVLGLLALMKESDPSPAQRRLIDQAERAGLQMTAMLADMLEIEGRAPGTGASSEAGSQAAQAAFSLHALGGALKDLFGPAAARNQVEFDVSVTADAPTRVTGDGRRLQRAVSHLVSHVLDKAGVRDVALRLDHSGAECRAELEFSPPPGGAKAVGLDEISESAAADAAESAAADGGAGLGPLLAKGLLEGMGGRLEISTLDSGRVLVLAATPSQAVADARPRVRVIAQSRSLCALGAAAADAADVDVLSLDEAPTPDIVLIEAGGAEEAEAVSQCRRLWPAALLLALGRPLEADDFDRIVPPPLAPALVSKAVNEAWSAQAGARASHSAYRAFAANDR